VEAVCEPFEGVANARTKAGTTPLDWVVDNKKILELLRKHGGKTGEELKAEGK
jgi:hypothetical protein